MEKKIVTLSEIKSDIENGLTRPQIREKYSLTSQDMKNIFSNKKLKNLKARKVSIVFIDDEEYENIVETVEEIVKVNETETENDLQLREEVFKAEREAEREAEEELNTNESTESLSTTTQFETNIF